MKIKIKKIFENAIWWSGVIMVGLILGISLQFVRAWTEPTDAPPGGNVGAPINTGANLQTKLGTLVLGILATDYIHNSSLPTAASGYVLTLDDPATGHVSWAPPSNGTPASGFQEFTSSGTWHSPPGVTNAWFYLVSGGGGGASAWGDPNFLPIPSAFYGWPGKAGQEKNISLPVTPDTNYEVKVGYGGSNGPIGGDMTAEQGGESSVSGLSATNTPGGAGGVSKTTSPGTWPDDYAGEINGTGYGTGGRGTDPPHYGGIGGAGTSGYVKITW